MLKRLLLTAAALTVGTTAGFANDLSGMSWDQIVSQAKEEGKVTWYVWHLKDDLRRAIQSFEEEYGIDVVIPEGTDTGNNEKLLAERNRETGDIDVFAASSDAFQTLDASALFSPLTMLPEDDGRVSEFGGLDGGDYIRAYWGNQTGIAYDPAQVDETALPQTPEEIAQYWDAYPNKFGFNYQNGGSGPSFYQNVLRVISGKDFSNGEVTDEKVSALQSGFDFFNEHAENYLITTSNSDSITRISDGELAMAPAWEDHLSGLQKRGQVRKDIKFYIPEMGMNGGGNGVAIPRNAENPAAAAVFINWLTSPETQTAFNRDFGTAPMNEAADDSFALVPAAQRKFRAEWAAQPFQNKVADLFIDNVIFER
ncbi:extracellular solute-binding protein [Pseudovibrio japonicus]|uniref:extracellular solute-binding protein n=1 Tax=Pseudovibrio japonicus TaxID=366534 RepID=UPI001AD8C010|nr:extracellular solute-binding protein [Pseudovibrio japonicus]